jgi:hypothetical protein
MKNSNYANWAGYIKGMTGLDCSKLTEAQMDEVGATAERASIYWDWRDAVATDESSDSELRQIDESKNAIEGVFSNRDEEPNEKDLVAAYVCGTWDEVVS